MPGINAKVNGSLACIARVSVGLGSKERLSNGVFGILPHSPENGVRAKKRMVGVGEGKEGKFSIIHPTNRLLKLLLKSNLQ